MPATNLSELFPPRLPKKPGPRFFAGLAGLANPLQGRIRWCEVRSARNGVITAVDLDNNLPITFEPDGLSPDSACRFLAEDIGRRREPGEADDAIAAFRARSLAALELLDVTDDTLTVTRNCIGIFARLQDNLDVQITPTRLAVLDKTRQRLGIVSNTTLLQTLVGTALQQMRKAEEQILAGGGILSNPDNEQEPSRLYKGLRFARDYLNVFIADKDSVRGSLADKLVTRQLDPALTMLSWGKGGLSDYQPLEMITQSEMAAAFGSSVHSVTYQSWAAKARAHGYTDDAGWYVDRENLDASDLVCLDTDLDLCPPAAYPQPNTHSRGMRL